MHMPQQYKPKRIIVKKVSKPSLRKFFQIIKCMILLLKDTIILPLQEVLQCIFLALYSRAKYMTKFHFLWFLFLFIGE